MHGEEIPGYTYGRADVARSPVTDQELDLLKQTVMFTDEDVKYLHMAGEVLGDQVEAILDVWYGFVGSHPHLVHAFAGPDGRPDAAYLDAVRRRFGQWIRDTCAAKYDRTWLDYQHEIALRHTPAKKNETDHAAAVADHVELRYIIAFIAPITATIRPFLESKGRPREQVEKMHQAWLKSVVLQVALWAQPFAKAGVY